jgi:hypothetical protein
MSKAIAGGIILVALAAPALAADQYWAIKDSATRNCTIVEEKPTSTTTTTVIGNAATIGNTPVQTRTEVRAWKQSCLD